MDSPRVELEAAYNSAIAAIFRGRKAELRLSNPALADATEINKRTLIRLLQDQHPMEMPQFVAIANALGLAPAKVMAEAETRVSNSSS